ncbi:MAG: hypothetical protein JNJ50_18305 [Acidobacteria bacterium]|nr:hypothetical protein [Acidobacteriota bacterium]
MNSVLLRLFAIVLLIASVVVTYTRPNLSLGPVPVRTALLVLAVLVILGARFAARPKA